MNVTDFGLSVLAGWLANKLDLDLKSQASTSREMPKEPKQTQFVEERKFKTFDVYIELETILEYLHSPTAHIIIETTPSSFYNLASLVMEDTKTGMWFVFYRGRMAFQGSGGGKRQTERAISIFRDNNIPIATWSTSESSLDRLDGGSLLWTELKPTLIPLLATEVTEREWECIQSRAKEHLYSLEG